MISQELSGQGDPRGVEERAILARELETLTTTARINAKRALREARKWSRWHRWLGVSATVAAGLAATTGLTDVVGLTGVSLLALASAVLTGLATSLDAAGNAQTAHGVATDLFALEGEARRFRNLDLPGEPLPDVRSRVEGMLTRQVDLYRQTPLLGFYFKPNSEKPALEAPESE